MLCSRPLGRKVARGYDVVGEIYPMKKMTRTKMRGHLAQELGFSNDDCLLDLDQAWEIGNCDLVGRHRLALDLGDCPPDLAGCC